MTRDTYIFITMTATLTVVGEEDIEAVIALKGIIGFGGFAFVHPV